MEQDYTVKITVPSTRKKTIKPKFQIDQIVRYIGFDWWEDVLFAKVIAIHIMDDWMMAYKLSWIAQYIEEEVLSTV